MRPPRTILLSLLAVLPPSAAWAGGQYAGDNGSLAAQRAGAFTARADDPTALYHNPAALTKIPGRQLFLGVNVVQFDQSFERTGSYQGQAAAGDGVKPAYAGEEYPRVEHDGPVQPVPFVSAAFATDQVALAIGVFAPHGYSKRSYPDTVETASGDTAPAPQRYDTVEQDGLIALPSAAIALPLGEKISVGGRVSYGFARLASRRFTQGLPNDAEDPGRDTDASLQVRDDEIFTFGLGVHVRASERVELGASYSAPVPIDARGTSDPRLGEDLRNLMPGEETRIVPLPDSEARCAPGGSEGALATCLDLALPQTATVAARYVARDGSGREIGDLELDLRWENWAAVDQYRVVVDGQNSTVETPINPTVIQHGFQDVYSVRLGGSRRLGAERQYLVSLGLGYESAAAPITWTRLDVDTAARFIAAGGMSAYLGDWRLDVGATFVDPNDRRVYDMPVENPDDMSQRVQPDVGAPLQPADQQPYHPFNAGSYSARYLIGSLGLVRSW